jgi:hypothetical protein
MGQHRANTGERVADDDDLQRIDAEDIFERHRHKVRDLIEFGLIGLILYGILVALVVGYNRSSTPTTGDEAPTRFESTISVPDGAAILALLATLVVASHVAVSQIKSSGPGDPTGYVRRRLIGRTSIFVGIVATATGAATFFHDLNEFNIGQLAVAAAAFAVAVFAGDVRSVLGTDSRIDMEVDGVRHRREVDAITRVIGRWETTRAHTRVTMVRDVAAVGLVGAAPLAVLAAVRSSHPLAERPIDIGIALLAGVVLAGITQEVVYRGVLAFVTRDPMILIASIGFSVFIAVVTAAATIARWNSNDGTAVRLVLIAVFIWVFYAPQVLVAAGFWKATPAWVPGTTARPRLHAALTRHLNRLKKAEPKPTSTAAKRNPISALIHRYRLATGLVGEDTPATTPAPDPDEGPQMVGTPQLIR